MSIMDLVRKKKSMQFKAEHKGNPKVGMFGEGVKTYGSKSVSERIGDIKEKFRQKQAETAILSKEKPRTGVVSVNGSVLNDRSRGGRMRALANKVKSNIDARSKANSASYLTNNNNRPYYLQSTSNSNNTPYYINSNGGGSNPAWNWLTKEKQEVKEKSRNITIKIK